MVNARTLTPLRSLVLFGFALLLGSGCTAIKQDHSDRTQIEARHAFADGRIAAGTYIKRSDPDYPSYDEIKQLMTDPHADPAVAQKLAALWRAPIIDNRATFAGITPQVASNQWMGSFIRFTQWNIEKSLEIPRAIAALKSEDAYLHMIDTRKAAPGSVVHQRMLRQRQRLAESDIIILQEMDIGVPRSGYRDAAGDLAAALGMNYAYGTQYIELDPTQVEQAHSPEEQGKYKGLFGSAILTRYPIKNVELRPLNYQPYDWYAGELAEYGPLEIGRRFGSQLVFKNHIYRELKVGGRNFFRIDLEVPGLPNDTLTVIVVHLEIKCEPKARRKEMAEILSSIKHIANPVIMAGDFNSAPSDVSQISVLKVARHTLANPSTYLSLIANVATAFGGIFNEGRWVFNTAKNFHSPLATHIPVVAPNPVRPMFDDIEAFRFDDGGAFDFRGEAARSINGRASLLSNSNHKDVKGQVTSFSVRRPIGPVGKYRLDWIFVKSDLKHPEARNAGHRFAPHYGETLKEFNQNLLHPLSDHRPCIVDLPLQDPPRLKKAR